MKMRFLCVCVAVAAIGGACSPSTNPTEPSGGSSPADTSSSASITVARAVAPEAGAQIRNADQPVTLAVTNAVTTQGTPVYTFEVATDASFASKVFTKGSVPQGNGQTSITIDRLPANADYYWRARAEGGGTMGPFTAARKFTIGPAIFIDAPSPVTPANGSVSAGWPVFTVRNSARSGPIGSVSYRFEVSTTSSFGALVMSSTVAETANQTSFTPPSSQPAPSQSVLFWRVIAVDPSSGFSSQPSPVQSFTYAAPTAQALLAAQQGLTLWPGAQPPGNTGHAQMGPNWVLQTIRSFDGVVFVSPTIEELRVFDLLDRGMDPNGAIAWMNANGYATVAVYYSSVQSIGFPFQYMALVNGAWELVTRVGA